MSRRTFAAAIAAGLLLRLLALPSAGTGDTTIWKVWMFNAARGTVGSLYGVGGMPPERRILRYAGAEAPVDYPPLALFELGAVGRLYRTWSHGRFPNTDALNAFAKLAPLAADIVLACLVHAWFRSRWTTIAYWLNPAVILDASVLGYLDPLFVLPAISAIVAAAAGYAAVAGALIAAAVLTKAQAIFIAPAVVMLVVARAHAGDRSLAVIRFVAASLVVTAATVAPIVIAGGLPNMIQALSRLAQHDMVSANACNLWWIVGYVVRAAASMHDLGAWTAFTMPTRILGITRLVELGYPNPRAVGLALTAAAAAWALWTGRRVRSAAQGAGVAAFLVHAYSVLAAQVHENHLFAAVPLLVFAGARLAPFRSIAVGVTAVAALNLNLFYGFGNGVGYALPRGITVVDATVVLAAVNCVLLWRHAMALRAACSMEAGCPPAPAPAFRPAPEARTGSSATHI